jgi:hypothetical protein
MKKLSISIISVVVLLEISCKKDTQPDFGSFATTGDQKAMVASGTWKVTYFNDMNTDLTSDYSTYLFQFVNDGSAVASSNGIGVLYFGSWDITQEMHAKKLSSGILNSADDNNVLQIKLNGNFHMDEMSGNWKIEKLSKTELWLKAGSFGSMKEIHFAII